MTKKKAKKPAIRAKSKKSALVKMRDKLLKSAMSNPGVKEAMEVYKASIRSTECPVDVYEVERESISYIYHEGTAV